MKKIILGISLLAASFLYAGESEDFYYDRGYENGYQKGLIKGQMEAFSDAKRILQEYKERIKAYELGKYLVQKQRLTAPQVYQELDSNGNMKIVVIPSRIQKELNIDEIFEEFGSLPRLSHGIKKQLSNTGKKDFNELNSVYLANRDNISDILPNKASKNSTKSVLRISKSSSNRDILNSANVAYVENKYNYEVIFFTKQEKLEFCTEFKKFCR